MTRVLVVLDHPRADDYTADSNGRFYNTTNSSSNTRLLKALLQRPQSGFGLQAGEYDVTYIYDKLPRMVNNTYLPVAKKEIQPILKAIKRQIVTNDYDLVILFGSLAIDNLLEIKRGQSKFNFTKQTYEYDGQTKEVTTATLPHLMKLRKMTRMNHDNFVIIARIIKRYLKGGWENLKPQMGKYEYVTDFKRAKEILTKIIPQKKLVATDFETNTLKTWLPKAKAIMFSVSWQEHQGVAIPLEHKQSPWTKEQLAEIIQDILNIYDDPKITKVMHNSNYDLSMLMNIYHMEHATNVIDTMMCYYLTEAEDTGALRGLKHLACMYTDMAGYEDDRDKAMQAYLDNDYQQWYNKQLASGLKPTAIHKSDYQPPTNEVDGSANNFEWLPLDVIYPYASADTDVTLQLYHRFDKVISKPEHKKWQYLAYVWYPQLIETLAYMEHTGFHFNKPKAEKYQKVFAKLINDTVKQMYEDAPEIAEYEQHNLDLINKRKALMSQVKPADRTPEQLAFIKEVAKLNGTDSAGVPKYKFNPASKSQLQYILFDLLGYQLPLDSQYLSDRAIKAHKLSHPEKITIHDYKVDGKATLPYLEKTYHDKFISDLVTYTRLTKLQTGFVEPLLSMVDPNGNIHCTFTTVGTATSRLASKNPK